MLKVLLRRLLGLGLTLLAASLLIFFLLEILPGDPAQVMLGIGAREDTLAALRTQLVLDRPLIERYLAWLFALLRGDFGISYTYSVPVADLVKERLALSLPLALMALLLSSVIAFAAGTWAALNKGRLGDYLTLIATQIGIAVPNFWFGLILSVLFGTLLFWLPALGFPGWGEGFWPAFRALILPATALALPQAAILTRIMRSSLVDVMAQDFIRMARAKGYTKRASLWRHALRNALIPVLTILGLQFSFLLAGAIVIESVFNLPGLGDLLIQATKSRDLVVVKSLSLLLVASVIFVNFVVDLAQIWVDPRLRNTTA